MKGQPPMQAWTDGISTKLRQHHRAIGSLPIWKGGRVDHRDRLRRRADGCCKAQPRRGPGRHGMHMVSSGSSPVRAFTSPTELAVRGIRQRHPPTAATDVLQSEPDVSVVPARPGHPTKGDAEPVFYVQQAMKVRGSNPGTSTARCCGWPPESRYVAGMQLRVDASGYLK